MKHESRLKKQEESELQQQQGASQKVMEFSTPEELLRFDAQHNQVPAHIEEKLKESVGALPPKESKTWWEKLLGR